MSGIKNIKELAKKYKNAKIYFHIDLDGVTSAIAMREYLKKYGIITTSVQQMNYGEGEYSISAPNENEMGVMVDFSHSKPFIKIHTDHHESQLINKDSSKHFRKSKSNASTISSIIGGGIFSQEDEKIINMIDSADYVNESIKPIDINQAVFNCNKDSLWENQKHLGLVCNKLLLSYKNRKDWLNLIVMNCNPSLKSIYNYLNTMIEISYYENPKYTALPKQINENADWYFENQFMNCYDFKDKNTLDCINSLSSGKYGYFGDIVVQNDGGNMKKIGCYDRYTIFRCNPNVSYYVMLWSGVGMIQVSRNPWNKCNTELDLGQVILRDLVLDKLKDEFLYEDISILAIKKEFESKINDENENDCIGFGYNDLISLFPNIELKASEEDLEKIKKCMNFKPSKYYPGEDVSFERKEQSMRMIKFMNSFRIPLYDIIKVQSGGHKSITNIVGFNFLRQQHLIDVALSKNDNPYRKLTKEELEKIKENNNMKKSSMQRMLNMVAENVVNTLKEYE